MNHLKQTKYGIMAAAVGFILISSIGQAKAYSNYNHYSAGWSDGQTDARYHWENNYAYSPQECNGHSHDYCQGYYQGYDEYWHRAQAQNVDSNNNAAENNANVKVNGNNNRVEINQNNGQNSGTDNSGSNSPY